MEKQVLKGITWGHSRGYTPLVAYAQRFAELNPGVRVEWKQRTLQEFADFPIEKLTAQYDLLIIDHPWVGTANAARCVLPLEEYLDAAYLQDQLDHSIGGSHESYNYGGSQWALAIDAATPVASARMDLFAARNEAVPQTWEDLLQLADKGLVAVPAIPIDLLMNFYMFCRAMGHRIFEDDQVAEPAQGIEALNMMRELWGRIDPKFFQYNPIAVAEAMTNGDEYLYCPFAYGYSNYSRLGYTTRLLTYQDLVSFNGKPFSSTIGGTGIAVSAASQNKELAVKFAKEICSGLVQSTFYVQHGGQPGHASAWMDEQANLLCNNYFTNTLPTLQNGYIRPRYHGYLHFQDHAGDPVQACMKGDLSPAEAMNQINHIYRESKAYA